MNLTINSLPSRTWNRLGMNEARVALEGTYLNHIPEARWNPEEVLWTEDAKAGHIAFPDTLRTELDALTEEAGVGFAETKPGVSMTAPLLLTYRYGDQEHGISRLVLHAGAESRLDVVLLLQSKSDACHCAIETEVYADDRSEVNIYVTQLLGFGSVCLHNVTGICGENAAVHLTKLELGSGKLYAGANIDLLGKESSFETAIGYHARPQQLLDMNYVALHHGKNTNSLMEVSGTLEEDARTIFRGTIDFQKGCAGAKGTENENVLLLGDKMVNQTIPLILCKEEDVEGNHGASIGRLDDKVLFYLGSRGISEESAQKIIAEARIEAICSRIPDETVRALVHTFENGGELPNDEEL